MNNSGSRFTTSTPSQSQQGGSGWSVGPRATSSGTISSNNAPRSRSGSFSSTTGPANFGGYSSQPSSTANTPDRRGSTTADQAYDSIFRKLDSGTNALSSGLRTAALGDTGTSSTGTREPPPSAGRLLYRSPAPTPAMGLTTGSTNSSIRSVSPSLVASSSVSVSMPTPVSVPTPSIPPPSSGGYGYGYSRSGPPSRANSVPNSPQKEKQLPSLTGTGRYNGIASSSSDNITTSIASPSRDKEKDRERAEMELAVMEALKREETVRENERIRQ